MQLFVRDFNGNVRSVQVEAGVTAAAFCREVGLPSRVLDATRVIYNGRVIHTSEPCSLSAAGMDNGATVDLCLCLAGGKGGFGSNLRAAGKMKLTDNFDACRDLSGRRIRQQTVEKKLEEWKAQAGDRALEAMALKYAKEHTRKEKARQRVEVDVEAVTEEHRTQLQSVSAGLAEAVARATTARPGGSSAPQNHKRMRMDPLLAEMSDSDVESERDASTGDPEEDAASTPPDQEPDKCVSSKGEREADSSGESAGTTVEQQRAAEVSVAVPDSRDSEGPASEKEDVLDLQRLGSVEELERLGLDRLKHELSSRGLKAGGTLRQRAERLFRLKSTPLDELPESCFAKA